MKPIKNIFIERMEMLNPELCRELDAQKAKHSLGREFGKEQTKPSEFLLSDVKEKEVEI